MRTNVTPATLAAQHRDRQTLATLRAQRFATMDTSVGSNASITVRPGKWSRTARLLRAAAAAQVQA